jgi:hypothetical protein
VHCNNAVKYTIPELKKVAKYGIRNNRDEIYFYLIFF